MVFLWGGDRDSYSMHGGVDGLWSFGHKQNPYSIIGERNGQVLRKKGMYAARRPRTTLSAI